MTAITSTDVAFFARHIAPLAQVPRIARCQSRRIRHQDKMIWVALFSRDGQVVAFSGTVVDEDGAAHHVYLYAPDMSTYAALVAARDEAAMDAGATHAQVVCRASRIQTLTAAGYVLAGQAFDGGVATMQIEYQTAARRMAA